MKNGEDSGSPELIRRDIEATRERLGESLEELGSRLNPRVLKQHAKEAIHDATIGRVQNMARNTMDKANSAGRNVVDVVRENSIPFALIAVGAGWLMFNKRRGSSSESYVSSPSYESGFDTPRPIEGSATAEFEYYERGPVGDGAGSSSRIGGVKDKARETLSSVESKAQDAASKVSETASSAAGSVARRARMQTDRAQDAFQERPLVMGAIVAAVGLAAALAIPATEKESELMGEKRDELMEKARDVVQEKTEAARNVAQRVVSEVKSTAKEAAREEGLTT